MGTASIRRNLKIRKNFTDHYRRTEGSEAIEIEGDRRKMRTEGAERLKGNRSKSYMRTEAGTGRGTIRIYHQSLYS